MYCCGVDAQTKDDLVAISGFQLDSLPLKYLGVPISSKKIQAGDCRIFVEKMVARIKVWSTRHLSFAGRMQLINSVLMSISVYWGQNFLIPSVVIRKINVVCKSYLWFGVMMIADQVMSVGISYVQTRIMVVLGSERWQSGTKQPLVSLLGLLSKKRTISGLNGFMHFT